MEERSGVGLFHGGVCADGGRGARQEHNIMEV